MKSLLSWVRGLFARSGSPRPQRAASPSENGKKVVPLCHRTMALQPKYRHPCLEAGCGAWMERRMTMNDGTQTVFHACLDHCAGQDLLVLAIATQRQVQLDESRKIIPVVKAGGFRG